MGTMFGRRTEDGHNSLEVALKADLRKGQLR